MRMLQISRRPYAAGLLGIAGCCLFALSPMHVQAQMAPMKGMDTGSPAASSTSTPAAEFESLLSRTEKQFVDAADAMPEDKYNFVPTTGEYKTVRNFGQQITHVISANNGFFFKDPTAPPVDMKAQNAALAKLTTKADIMAALKESFANAHKYVAAITPENAFTVIGSGPRATTRVTNAAAGIAHYEDIYGQMVEYLRLNGIIPPASRGTGM